MKVLIISNNLSDQLNENLTKLLTAASKINNSCDVLLIGNADHAKLSYYPCINQILLLQTTESSDYLATSLATGLASICQNYTHVLMAADSYGKDLLPRIAGVLDVSQLSEVVEIISPNIFKRPIYAGNVIAEIESFESIKLLTIRCTSFASYAALNSEQLQVAHQLEFTPVRDDRIQFLHENISYHETIGLASAQIIISGGRSLGSVENFTTLIQGLAVKLGGAVGATRAAVEAGYAGNDSQVGQTGQVVAPKLYLAIGVSGAVQHIAGMKDSQIVIAVNIDENAQIFEYADYGLVGDLFEIIPQLIDRL